MARFAAYFDSQALVNPDDRALLLRIGAAGLYTPLTSERCIRSALNVGAQFSRDSGRDGALVAQWLEKQTEIWLAAFDPYLVSDYADLEDQILFEPREDRHVVAAALVGGADVIVTRDTGILQSKLPGRLSAQTADEFLAEQFAHDPELALACIDDVCAARKIPLDRDAFLAHLASSSQRAPSLATEVWAYLGR